MEPTTKIKAEEYENSICITPGIVFDLKGYRVGYGKGFYDRFFSKYTGVKIGLCASRFLINHIQADEYDVPVNMIITEKGGKGFEYNI